MKKKLKGTFFIAIITGTALAIAYLVTVNFLKISYNAKARANIYDTITITRTSNGFPTIHVENEDDMYFALGYCHAQDRLNYLEYQRAIAISAADKIVKENSKILNKLSRTMGFTQKASNLKKKLSPGQIKLLQKYCNGINFIRKKDKQTRIIKRDWFPEDLLAILIMKEWANAFLNNMELKIHLNKDTADSRIKSFLKSKYTHYYSQKNIDEIKALRQIKELVKKYIGTFSEGLALGIPSQLTKDIKDPINAFIYSSTTALYPNLYPAKIKMPESTLHVITMAGLPFFYAFKKENMAFFSFNLKSDTQKIFLLKTKVINNLYHYKTPKGFKKVTPLRIPDFAERMDLSFNLNWETQYGPILSNINSESTLNEEIITIKSIFPDRSYIDLFFNAPQEKKISSIKYLILGLQSGVKTFFISHDNKRYTAISGSYYPKNYKSKIFEKLSSGVLKHRIQKFKQHKGIAYTGSHILNEQTLGKTLGDVTTDNSFRIKKLKSILQKRRIYDAGYVKTILFNSSSIAAETLLPHFLNYLENNPATSARLAKIYLSDWDMKISPKGIAPTIFYSDLFHNIMETFRDKMGSDGPFNFRSINLLVQPYIKLLQRKNVTFLDKKNTDVVETAEDIHDRAFLISMRELSRKSGPRMENWKWGEIYKSHFKIPNMEKSILFSFLKRKKLSHCGNFDTMFNSLGNPHLEPETVPSLAGICHDPKIYLKFNFGYSTSLLSDYFYWKTASRTIKNLQSEIQTSRTVLTPVN